MGPRRLGVVFVGGGIGAVARDALAVSLMPGTILPLATLLTNCLGAFFLGVVFVLADEAGLLRTRTRLFLAVGVLGGFTTFSTFTWGTDTLLGAHHPLVAILYLAATLLGGIIAVLLGLWSGRKFLQLMERAALGVLSRLEEGRRTGGAAQDMGLIETEDRDESA